jgi:ABC-type branched-subunit amino acid transport system substrate-binding protein
MTTTDPVPENSRRDDKPVVGRRRLRPHRLGLLLFAAAAGCVDPAKHPDPNSIQVGALLPFTGDMAASGVNIERSLLMAAERINEAQGVAGRKIHVVSVDAPDMQRGMAAAQELLEQPRMMGIFGPHLPDLYAGVVPLVAAKDLYGILPSEMAPSVDNSDGQVRWFHLAPRIESVACAMAQTIYNDYNMSLVILATDDDYNRAFAQALYDSYRKLSYMGSRPTATLQIFNPQAWGTQITLQSALPDRKNVIALLTYPRTAVKVIQDWTATGRQDLWYFGPALRTNVFVDNTPPGVLESMKGFSAYIPEDVGSNFSAQFAERWGGDTPMTDAFYYYDALALSALAIASAAGGQAVLPPSSAVRERIIPISRGAGTPVDWQDLGNALALARSGQAIHYAGASGHVDLTDDGYLQSTIETISVWQISGGLVQPFAKTTCLKQ